MLVADGRTPLDWGGLQAFLAICETGAVARAARRLQVSHAAVIRRLDGLEQALGTALFERRATEYVLTRAGEALRRDLDGLGSRIDGACDAVEGADDRIDGTIRVSITDILLRTLLAPHLKVFCDAHPGIHLQVGVHDTLGTPLPRDVDLAIRATNQPPENVLGRHVGDLQFLPYASPNYLRAARSHPADALHWIAIDDACAPAEQARWYRRHVPSERIVMRVSHSAGLADAAAHGIGAALLPIPLARRHGLVALEPQMPALYTQVWLLSHPDMRQVARVRTFAQEVATALRVDVDLHQESRP